MATSRFSLIHGHYGILTTSSECGEIIFYCSLVQSCFIIMSYCEWDLYHSIYFEPVNISFMRS